MVNKVEHKSTLYLLPVRGHYNCRAT